MIILFDDLVKEHAKLWPDTTIEQQMAKWNEEFEEYMNTQQNSNEELAELADMFIVSAGIARFDYAEGLEALHNTLVALRNGHWWSIKNLLNAVDIKMEKNRSRKWAKKDDVGYKHTEE